MRRSTKLILAFAVQLGLVLALAPVSAQAATLVDVTYINGPYARTGWVDVPVAVVHLDSPAVGDTTVSTSSSNTAAATVPAEVTVPSGQSSTVVPLTGLANGATTISASLGLDMVSAAPALEVADGTRVAALSSLSLEPASVLPGDGATATVTLDFLAPPGGATIALSSGNPKVHIPDQLTMAQDSSAAQVPVTTDPDATGSALIEATLDAATKQATLNLIAVDLIPPGTLLGRMTIRRAARAATFRFSSTEPGSTFRCKLDRGPFRPCSSPRTYRRLKRGRHVFQVTARDSAGNTDPTPARKAFRIRRPRR